MDTSEKTELIRSLQELFTRLRILGYLDGYRPGTAEPPATAAGGSGQTADQKMKALTPVPAPLVGTVPAEVGGVPSIGPPGKAAGTAEIEPP